MLYKEAVPNELIVLVENFKFGKIIMLSYTYECVVPYVNLNWISSYIRYVCKLELDTHPPHITTHVTVNKVDSN
ncbi:hypothetical protein PRUPE_2G223100 [Prunus persica]|uniref:Uncharacterized protein n=1 Tax=Prunus persica TaxID=3760 RepID=M5XLI7_PRUPE|nr:hypothetical protein PRUPE_2G223100 [Prunus persica]